MEPSASQTSPFLPVPAKAEIANETGSLGIAAKSVYILLLFVDFCKTPQHLEAFCSDSQRPTKTATPAKLFTQDAPHQLRGNPEEFATGSAGRRVRFIFRWLGSFRRRFSLLVGEDEKFGALLRHSHHNRSLILDEVS